MSEEKSDEEILAVVEGFADLYGRDSIEALETLYDSRLTALSIYGSKDFRLDDASLATLMGALATSAIHVGSVILKHHRITSTAVIVDKIIKDENRLASAPLRYLDLENNDIDFEGAIPIIDCIGEMDSGLETLNLSCNPLSTDAALRISDSVSVNKMPKLRHLLVANCDFSLKAVIALTTSLDKNLEALVLDRPIISTNEEEHTDHFSRLLSAHSTLTEVSLRYNKIFDRGATSIAQSLTMNQSLILLNLECNNISVAGAEALASYLIKVDRLATLLLAYNNIQDEGAIAIAQALEKNTSLRDLSLKTNKIGPKGLVAIADAMEQNNTLQNLTLFGNEFNDPACKRFGRLIEERFPYIGVSLDIEVYVVDGVHNVALKDV
jgi:hypothetical protein